MIAPSNAHEIDIFRLNALSLRSEADCDLMAAEIEAAIASARRRRIGAADDELSDRVTNAIDSLEIKLASVRRRAEALKGRDQLRFEQRFVESAKATLPEDTYRQLVALANGRAA